MAGVEPAQAGQLSLSGRQHREAHIKPVIGGLKVAGPTKLMLQGLVDNWTAVDHLAPSTVHRMASTLHALPNGLVGADPGTLIFSTAKRHRPLRYSNWRSRVWAPTCEQAGLAGLGFHDLRRNNAIILHHEGTVVKVAQERLGHKQSSTTLDTYTRATRRRHREEDRRGPASR